MNLSHVGALTCLALSLTAPSLTLAQSATNTNAANSSVATSEQVGALTTREDVKSFIEDMSRTHAFDAAYLEQLFAETQSLPRVVQLVKPAPTGQPKNWKAYRARFIEPIRINGGVNFWKAHEAALTHAEEKYGVPAEVIVAIIGVETLYGRHTGNFRTFDALSTLAFDYPETHNRDARMRFFRGELGHLLLYARDEKIDPFSVQGSYAGAIGWPQFMPGSIRHWGVDFDGDGKVDLRNSPTDAIGSVANFLVEHGWRTGQPTAFPVTTPTNPRPAEWENFLDKGLVAQFELSELEKASVKPAVPVPTDLRYGLVYLENGNEPTEYWLGAENFYAITKYNRSYFYAMSVAELANTLRSARLALSAKPSK